MLQWCSTASSLPFDLGSEGVTSCGSASPFPLIVSEAFLGGTPRQATKTVMRAVVVSRGLRSAACEGGCWLVAEMRRRVFEVEALIVVVGYNVPRVLGRRQSDGTGVFVATPATADSIHDAS